MRKHLIWIVAFLLLIACGSNNTSQQTAPQDAKQVSLQDKLLHYWDHFPYDDRTALSDTALMQRLLGNWLQTLAQLPDNEAQTYTGIAITAGQGQPNGQKTLFLWLEDLLNDPNSPSRNEELFIPVLEAMTQDTLINDIDKTRPRMLLTQALKNRKGTRAADIMFITKSGAKKHLYDIHAAQILLYFFNPDCHDCKRVSDLLIHDPELNDLQRQGRMQVLALYPDEDLTSWSEMEDRYPADWIIGRSLTQREQCRYGLPAIKDLYNLPAIPSVYILDSTYTVLVKDATP